jgi:ferredoxin
MSAAAMAAIGLVITLGVVSLLSGGLHFLFARPRIDILKSEKGENGFAFSYSWNSAREPAKFNKVKVRLFNPFGAPTQVEVSREFDLADSTFARDVDFGEGMKRLLSADGLEDALVQIEMTSTDQITHQKEMKGAEFLRKIREARESAKVFNEENETPKDTVFYHSVQRSFISGPLGTSNKALKLATNPEFAGEFATAGGGGEAKENFSVSKVWIDPGCIVCNACEGIYPEVFEVTDDSCLIRPNAPLDNGLLIVEAADACPVEVIKFTKS